MPFAKPDSTRPKRLLSLDGGGIRGLISAEILIRIEDILKQLKPGLSCLADYSAAPTYFSPHQFVIGARLNEFIDGGVTPYNNPSWQLFLEATQPNYNVGWDTGADRLLQISIGTGFSIAKIPGGQAKDYTLLNWAPYTVGSLMDGANLQQNLLMELIADTPGPRLDETDLGLRTAMDADSIAAKRGIPPLLMPELELLRSVSARMPKLLTYRRYTTAFTERRFQQLQQVPGLTASEIALLAQAKPADVADLDCVDQRDLLCAIGRAIALEQVRSDLFEPFLHED